MRALLLFALPSCSAGSGAPDHIDGGSDAGSADSGSRPDAAADAAAPDAADTPDAGIDLCDDGLVDVVVRSEAARKVCQLTGDFDQELGLPTSNRTEERFGLRKTDLGVSFEHAGGLFFFFGDSVDRWDGFVGDAMATTDDLDASDCVDLEFPLNGFGQFLAPVVPGITLGGCEVPMEGIDRDGAIFGYFTTDAAAGCDMGRSVAARSDDTGETWTFLHDLSTQRFINVSAVVVREGDVPGLSTPGDVVLFFGSGRFRQSDISLAIQPADDLGDPNAISYFEGVDAADCTPRFGPDEALAADLLAVDCVGELSAFFAPSLDRWVLLYGCDEPRGIVYQVARFPWGPWSEPAVLFDPSADGGYCRFMHEPGCDTLDDPAPGEVSGHWGGEYAPYVIPTSVTDDAGTTRFHFTMSTWNPYQVVVMEGGLEFR